MNIGRVNKAIAFFLVALSAWIGGVIAEHPDELQVSLVQWGELLVGVVIATFIGYLTKNADPVEPAPPPPVVTREMLIYQPDNIPDL